MRAESGAAAGLARCQLLGVHAGGNYTCDWGGGASKYGLTEPLGFDSGRTEIVFTYTTDEFVLWLKSGMDGP